MKKNFNIVMIDFDKSIAPERELLSAAIALANNGGGVIFTEGEALYKKGLSTYMIKYIVNMTIPTIYPIIDILFPKTNWKIHIPPAVKPVSSVYGDVYSLDGNLVPNKIYPSVSSFFEVSSKDIISENPQTIFDRELSAKAAKKLGKTKKYKGIENFDLNVFYKSISAFKYDQSGNYPTFSGLLLFGKSEIIKKFIPFSGAVYTLGGAKRETIKKISFSGETLFLQRQALCYEIMKDSKCCRESSSFIFAFSNALFAAFSLRDQSKKTTVKIYNRNGTIEISFSVSRKNIPDNDLEKEVLKTELGKILNILGERFFKKGATKTAKNLMISEGLSPYKILFGKSFAKIILDFKHKTT